MVTREMQSANISPLCHSEPWEVKLQLKICPLRNPFSRAPGLQWLQQEFREISFGKLKLASMNTFFPLGENIAQTIISVSAKKNKKRVF